MLSETTSFLLQHHRQLLTTHLFYHKTYLPIQLLLVHYQLSVKLPNTSKLPRFILMEDRDLNKILLTKKLQCNYK